MRLEGPDATEVRDRFPERELGVTGEAAVADEASKFELELTEPVGLEEGMLIPGWFAARTTRKKCMSAGHCCTVIQARIVTRRTKRTEESYRFYQER